MNKDGEDISEYEVLPPVLPAVANSEIIKTKPIKIIEENHKKNYVKISIYEISGGFYFGYQLKVDRIVRQKCPTMNDTARTSAEEARLAARDEIKDLCGHNRFIREIFEDFTMIKYNQGELF